MACRGTFITWVIPVILVFFSLWREEKSRAKLGKTPARKVLVKLLGKLAGPKGRARRFSISQNLKVGKAFVRISLYHSFFDKSTGENIDKKNEVCYNINNF